jgi:hypothetical protein
MTTHLTSEQLMDGAERLLKHAKKHAQEEKRSRCAYDKHLHRKASEELDDLHATMKVMATQLRRHERGENIVSDETIAVINADACDYLAMIEPIKQKELAE